jgi:ribosome recycling factor
MNLDDVKMRMDKVLEFLRGELQTIRTGTASPAMVENVLVEAYEGTPKMRLQELATISVPEPRQLLIKPFDQTILRKIEKAIYEAAELRLTPVVEADFIRITIPSMTQERREEFVKVLHQRLETGRVAIRQVRHDKMIDIKKAAEAGELTEDVRFKLEGDLQAMTDEMIKRMEEIGTAKEKEIMAI